MKLYLFFAMMLLACLMSNGFAENDMLMHRLQTVMDSYLANQGKREGVTGMAATVFFPVNDQSNEKTLVAGVVGYPPYDKKLVTPHNLFEIGSITKSFTAVLILQLEAEGLLDIDDKIGRWLPQYPNWKEVTIRQLLNMTSNIPSYTRDETFQKEIYGNMRIELTDQQMIGYAQPDKPIKKHVRFDYSNSNYILAGLIIEAITKHTFADELQKRIISPFHLSNTYYVAGKNWKAIREEVMPRMVHGYYYDDVSKKMVDATDSNLSWGGPAGGIVSDTQDVTQWVQILYHGLAIPEKFRQKAMTELESMVSMDSGQPITIVSKQEPKGFGLGVGGFYDDKRGRFWIYEGSGMGYRMMYIWRACNNVSVVAVLNNKGGEGEGGKHGGDHIMELVLGLYDEITSYYPKTNCKD